MPDILQCMHLLTHHFTNSCTHDDADGWSYISPNAITYFYAIYSSDCVSHDYAHSCTHKSTVCHADNVANSRPICCTDYPCTYRRPDHRSICSTDHYTDCNAHLGTN